MSLLNAIGFVGLLLDLIGAMAVLLPDTEFLNQFTKTRSQENLQAAKQTLFENERISQGAIGFDELKKVVVKRTGKFEDLTAMRAPVIQRDRFDNVRAIHPADEEGMNRTDEHLATRLELSLWVEQERQQLENDARHQFLVKGMVIMTVGFGLQLLATL